MPSLQPVSGILDKRRASHLLRRATFGASRSEIDQFANMTAGQALTELFKPMQVPQPPIDPQTGQPWVNPKPTDANSGKQELQAFFNGWWLEQMRKGAPSGIEKLTFFLHTHFTTIQSVVDNSTSIYHQNVLFRRYALGNFRALTKKVCFDNAMLRFLDSRLNVVGRPNENFGREILELYTIGKGPQTGADNYTNYTEVDVQAAAKILSGYINDPDFTTIDPETGIPCGIIRSNDGLIASNHDATAKTFSPAFQNRTIAPSTVVDGRATVVATEQELDEFLDMIFEQQETARFICRKIYRFFVYYNITPEVEADIIQPLANIFRNSNYEIRPVLEALLSSSHFYDLDNGIDMDDTHGAIIKSPVELVIGTLRFFDIEMPDPQSAYAQYYTVVTPKLLRYLQEQGIDLYEPYEVAGYSAYHQGPTFNRNWISSNYLARRYEFARHLLTGNANNEQGFQLDIIAFVRNTQHVTDPSNAEQMVRELVIYLLPEEISEERFNYFLNDLLLDNLSVINWANEWNNYLQTGDATGVRKQLENLLYAILQSPEYQLC